MNSAQTAERGRSPIILVIGEDPLMTRTIVRLLRRAGYHVIVRERDEERCIPVAPALIILDDPDYRPSPTDNRPPIPAVVADTPVLWISNRPSMTGEPTMIKPFTSADLLRRVELILRDPAPVPARVS
jgi:DNA-binding response OmpR family regulator